MLGKHCIKTWCASEEAFAPSSAEAESHATIEGATKAKGLLSLAGAMRFEDLANVVGVWQPVWGEFCVPPQLALQGGSTRRPSKLNKLDEILNKNVIELSWARLGGL